MAQLPDYYAALGISRYATQEEITQKYNELLAQNPAEAQLEKINAAYEMLSDMGKRQRYDFDQDQSMSRIRGSYSDYITEAEDSDPESSDSGTTLDDLMAQSKASFDQATSSLDDMLTGAEAISGQSGTALDDLLADPVDTFDEIGTTLDDLLTDAQPPVDQTPPDAVRSRHPGAIPTQDAPPPRPRSDPRRPQVRKASHTVKVGGSIKRRPPPRSQSPSAKLPIVMAVVIAAIGISIISVFNRVEESESGSVISYPTMIAEFTHAAYPISPIPPSPNAILPTWTTIPRSPTAALPTAAVTRIDSEGDTNNTVPPAPTEIPDLSITSPAIMVTIMPGAEGGGTILEMIMDVSGLGLPIDLSGHDLSDEVLPAVPLQNANMEGTNLANANLNAANLQNANLRDANLQGATLRKTSLQGADLTGANLENALLTGAYFSVDTILPDGTAWTEDTDLTRFTNPNHPDFWQPE